MSEQIESQPSSTVARLFAPDALRGLIITLMALDHASLFIAHKHSSGEMWGGPFPVYSDALTFLTRFVTHFCAPGFFFLMGVGMALLALSRQEQGWSKWRIIRHFLIRGGAIIAVKFLVINRAWELTPGGWGIRVYLGVLWALGGTMILGSLLLWLKPRYLLALTAVLLIGIELLSPNPTQWGARLGLLNYMFLTPGGIIGSASETLLWSNYLVVPWLELVTLGIVFGKWLTTDSRQAFKRALVMGGIFLLAFVVIRYLNGFGNIRPRMSNSWIDLLNPVKYPPSIAFTLMTTGVNLIVLWLFSKAGTRLQSVFQPLVVFGRTPLFFYVLHLFLYAGLGYWLTPRGASLPAMYPIWLLGLLILYPLCRLYGKLKHSQPARLVLQFF
jgi:uncharacterized membrane protein